MLQGYASEVGLLNASAKFLPAYYKIGKRRRMQSLSQTLNLFYLQVCHLFGCHVMFILLVLKKNLSRTRTMVIGWVRCVTVLLPLVARSQRVTRPESMLRGCHTGAHAPHQRAPLAACTSVSPSETWRILKALPPGL